MFLGRSQAILRVLELIDKAARSTSTVLIVGETGVGKEVAAKEIHSRSGRRDKKLVAVNCSTLPRDLAESDLFGHERGAFTSAVGRRLGYFEQANGSTIFLDEITEMSRELQPKLLRVLEEHTIRRVGGEGEIHVDSRVIAATNRIPEEAVRDGHLREDLFHRLNVVCIEIPPLRERLDDLEILALHFIAQINREQGKEVDGLDSACLAAFRAYSWPGNVRELHNTIERGVINCERGRIMLNDLPDHIWKVRRLPAEFTVRVGSTLESVQHELIRRTLEATRDNRTEAAEMLGVERRQLYVLMHRNGFERKSKRNNR